MSFFFPQQVPVLIPILVLLASIYLIVAPFYEAPLESFLCLVFILTGIPVYFIFVRFNIIPQSVFDAIGKFRFRFNLLNLLTPKVPDTISLYYKSISTNDKQTVTRNVKTHTLGSLPNRDGNGNVTEQKNEWAVQ